MKIGSRVAQYLRTLNTSTDESTYREIYPLESIEEKRFYNIGAGDFSHPCWTNIDGGSKYYKELYKIKDTGIYHDLFDHLPLPIEDNSAEVIYTSHTIGLIDDASVNFLFNDCYRMLKPGGILRIVTPDTDLYYKAWRRNDRKFYYWTDEEIYNSDYEKQCLNIPLSKATLTQVFLEEFAAAASEIALAGSEKRISDKEFEQLFRDKSYEDALSYCTSLCSIELQKNFPFRHMNWFNEEKLKKMLIISGFKQPYRSGYQQSISPVLRNVKFFDKTVPQLSIFMEVVK